jgi:hypothetical protein
MEMNKNGQITTGQRPLDVFHLNLKHYPYYDVPVEDGVDRFLFASCRLTYHRERRSKLMPKNLER